MPIDRQINVGIAPYAVHRSESNFANPDRFDPDRWNEENRKKIHPGAYFPFSKGIFCILVKL